MPKQVQHVRGNTATEDARTGAVGEITVDTQAKHLRLHDGSTAGGSTILNETEVAALVAVPQGDIDTHILDTANPHTVTAAQVGAYTTAQVDTLVAAASLFGTTVNKATADSPVTIVANTDDGKMFISDTSGGNLVYNLPSIATALDGERYGFIRTSVSNVLTIVPNGTDTINGVAATYTVNTVSGEMLILIADDATPDNWILTIWSQASADETSLTKTGGVISVKDGGVTLAKLATAAKTESLIIACSDETTAVTAGTAKVTFRMPYALTLTDVKSSAGTAPTAADLIIDINESGTTILSTKLTIDAGEKTSTTAATPAVISDAALAADAEITIDFDQVGSTIAGAGVKVTLIGYKS